MEARTRACACMQLASSRLCDDDDEKAELRWKKIGWRMRAVVRPRGRQGTGGQRQTEDGTPRRNDTDSRVPCRWAMWAMSRGRGGACAHAEWF